MIGNAVPVTLGEVIGQSIAAHLGIEPEKTKRKKKGAVVDDARKSLVA
jgi:DNA (cytosine-5)-methyltransferase 1